MEGAREHKIKNVVMSRMLTKVKRNRQIKMEFAAANSYLIRAPTPTERHFLKNPYIYNIFYKNLLTIRRKRYIIILSTIREEVTTMKNMNKKGFSIVEVVVVMAVIAILAALVVPSAICMFDRVRVSNDRQEARNTYSYYLQLVDYVDGEQPVKNGAVLLKDGTLVELKDGVVDASVVVALEDVEYVIQADGKAVQTSQLNLGN